MENEIPEEKPLKHVFYLNSEPNEDTFASFENIANNDDDINKINSNVNEIVNHANEGPIKKSDYYLNDPDEDLNNNFIDIDHRNKPETKLSVSSFKINI